MKKHQLVVEYSPMSVSHPKASLLFVNRLEEVMNHDGDSGTPGTRARAEFLFKLFVVKANQTVRRIARRPGFPYVFMCVNLAARSLDLGQTTRTCSKRGAINE